ncbi:ATP-binding cassette sub-family F member 3-like [Liolophura sinensis]|uniref:ATP-binding cassette sub-family F member 3-like n=1 Tax=Liolophura sinensis TaxID=3198878 RepID=UPI0031597A8E
MAAFGEVLQNSFPNLDPDLYSYVNGILEDGSDEIDTADDLHDAIGGILQQVDETKTEQDIQKICSRLYNMMKGSLEKSNGDHRRLDAPVFLGQAVEEKEEGGSIWIAKKENVTQVDQRKLDKAEAKIQKKLEKRSQPEISSRPEAPSMSDVATASQQINRKDERLDASGNNRSCDIRIEQFDVSFGNRTLITGADVHLIFGRRYGFVGRNGLGKTTLLKMISSRQLKIPSHISILHVEQEVVGDDTLALDSVLECDEKRHSLLQEEKQINAQLAKSSEAGKADAAISGRLNEIYHELEAMEADKAPAKAAVILCGLGFTTEMQQKMTKEFSGGWRMRLALARALFTKPDLLLLDEPTNMLDMKAIIWLENYLQTWPTTILVVSHDRSFLDAVATDILHIHSQRIDTYRGNYEVFHKTRDEKLKNQQREFEAQKQYRDHIQVFIDRFRYNANRASQVQSKLKLLEKLPELKPVEKESEVILKFQDCDKLSPPILQLDEVEFYYNKDHVIFSNICVNANMGSRICIVGENGAGKTTLLKLLLGSLDPVRGIRHVHRSLRIGYFSQHHVDQLDMGASSVELLATRFPGKPVEVYRSFLGSFGVTGELATRPVGTLSGGQKSRVALATMSMTMPNFLILDEPTNHLDMETIEALGKALEKFQGGVVLVSHDERLIRMVCTEMWVVRGGTVRSLEGGFDEYKKSVEEELELQSR